MRKGSVDYDMNGSVNGIADHAVALPLTEVSQALKVFSPFWDFLNPQKGRIASFCVLATFLTVFI